MPPSEAYTPTNLTERHKRILASLSQPLTAKQIARKTGMTFDACRDGVRTLAKRKLLRCLNERARRSRVYWLTAKGKASQRLINKETNNEPPTFCISAIDWDLYGWVCYAHRAVIVKTLTHPMQPSEIKRRARSMNSSLRMSANNVRDIIHLFAEHGVVRPVHVRRRVHSRYELTDSGQQFQQLLRDAEAP